MDTKYIINADSKTGKINWVGIRTKDGKITLEKITNNTDSKVYVPQLLRINQKYGGDFFDEINNRRVTYVKGSFFEEKVQQYLLAKKAAEKEEKEKKQKRSKVKRAIVASALTVALTGASIGCQSHKDKKDQTSNELANNDDAVIQMVDEDQENTEVAIENKSLDELIDMLEDEDRKEAINKIVDVQDYFNTEAAPTVKQGNKQLYFNFDETTAAYLYANAKTLGSSKIASFFGQSNIMLLNEETGEYEQIDKDLAAAKYLQFCQNLSYYYQLGATEKSGVDGLFENKEEAKFFNSFEALILEYNRTKSSTIKAEIIRELENIFMSGEVDAPKDKYQGATSIIGTSMVPYLYLNKVIDKDMYESIVNINEVVTCQDIYSQIEKITIKMDKANGKEAIIEQIAKLQYELYKNLDRNLSLEESIEGYRLSDLHNAILGSTPGFASNETVTTHYSYQTTNRDEAVNSTSEDETKAAEDQADKDAGIDQKNEDETQYWNGYMDGYNRAYDNVWNGGSGNISTPSGSSKYQEGFRDGVAAGKKGALEDLAQEENDKENYQSDTQDDEIIDDTFIYEDNNDYSDDNNSNDDNTTTQDDEIIDDTFIYENNNDYISDVNSNADNTTTPSNPNTESNTQTVESVQSHESYDTIENTYEVTQESDSVVLVRVNP